MTFNELVKRRISKPGGLVIFGMLAAAVAAPIGCATDKFSGCETTRTCPGPRGGSSGEGGEAGGDTGGTSAGSSSGGSSGAGSSGRSGSDSGGSGGESGGNADPGGSSGEGGSGSDDDERPTIVTITPADGAAGVERDIELTVELSEPIGEATVTSSSVTLEGPEGNVEGTLSVDENVITFVPEHPLYLLGTYTFAIDDAVADLAGNALDEGASVEFQVRDGRWGTPTNPFGTAISRSVTFVERNSLGDVVLAMLPLDNDNIYTAVYHAAENTWTGPTTLMMLTPGFKALGGVAIDETRRAVVTWNENDSTYGWSRYTPGGGWAFVGNLPGLATVAATSQGLATAVWTTSMLEVSTRTQDLAYGTVGAEIPTALTGNPIDVVASRDDVAILSTRTSGSNTEIVVSWRQGSSWSLPQSIDTAANFGGAIADTDEKGNIILVWQDGTEIRSRTYDKSRDEWSSRNVVTTAVSGTELEALDMTSGNAILVIRSANEKRVAVYEHGPGWIPSAVVEIQSVYGSVSIALDESGNAVAAGTDVRSRRYITGQGWQAQQALSVTPSPDLDRDALWSASAPDGSTIVVANQISGSDYIPWVVRFE